MNHNYHGDDISRGPILVLLGLNCHPWSAQGVRRYIPIGSGIFVIWLLQGLKYLVDIYLMLAKSALPANTLIDFIHLGWIYGSIDGCWFIKETNACT